MEKHVKNQHYVPQFLLKNFSSTDANLIWTYDKQYNQVKERSISKVAKEDFFYDKIKGDKESSLEYALSKIETATTPIIRDIIASESITRLKDNEKNLIALFIALQLVRTKAFLVHTDHTIATFNKNIKDFANSLGLDIPEESKSKEVWFSMLESVSDLKDILVKKIWLLGESAGDFYISDNPVVLQNTYNNRPNRGNLGINTDGIEIFFPITSSLVICLYCERIYAILHRLPEAKLSCIPENIENINSLQVQQSERFVFSCKDNFDLVKDMIAKKQV